MTQAPIELVAAVPDARNCAPAAADVQVILPLLKLLSEPNRLKIVALLAGGERCVCEIEADMRLPQNLVSHHLGQLRDAHLIRARRAGRWVYYSVNKETLASVYPVICRLFNPDCVSDGAGDEQNCPTCTAG